MHRQRDNVDTAGQYSLGLFLRARCCIAQANDILRCILHLAKLVSADVMNQRRERQRNSLNARGTTNVVNALVSLHEAHMVGT